MSLFEDGVRHARGAHRVALLRRVSVRARHRARRRGQPRAADAARRRRRRAGARIAIVRLPCLSNATDFRLLTWADWIAAPSPADYDFIVLPGTKNTIARPAVAARDRPGGVDHRRSIGAGATVIGICGGYQMLGRAHPRSARGRVRRRLAAGLGAAAGRDRAGGEQADARSGRRRTRGGVRFRGYEIHLGDDDARGGRSSRSRASTMDVRTAPACQGVIGTYLHGALENPDVCAECSASRAVRRRRRPSTMQRLADWFEQHGRDLSRAWPGDERNRDELGNHCSNDRRSSLRRSGRFLRRRARRPAPRAQHLGRERRADGPRAIPAEPPELRRRRASRAPSRSSTRSGTTAITRSVCGEASVPPEQTAMMGTAANMNYAAVRDRDRRSRRGHRGRHRRRRRRTRPAPAIRRHWRETDAGMREGARLRRHDQHDAARQPPLTPAALARAVVTMTEGKSAALQRLAVPSRQSPDLATGTGTDQYCIAAPVGTGRALTSASPHVKLGELIGLRRRARRRWRRCGGRTASSRATRAACSMRSAGTA